MFSENTDIPDRYTPNELLASPDNSQAFQRIHIEYEALYAQTGSKQLLANIHQGIQAKLLRSGVDRERALQWKVAYDTSLVQLASAFKSNLIQQNKQLPTLAMRKLSNDPDTLLKALSKNPNDYLCHFQLAWLYLRSGVFRLAERHFNIAALQSQTVNPQFACYAFRHLSDVRYRAAKFPQALLALESARECARAHNPELQFEYVRMLSANQRTTQALKQLTLLITKAPHYEVLAHYEPDLLANPSIQRYLTQLQQQHQQNITNNLLLQWDNDPLRLLDLDKELGRSNSLEALRKKQQYSLQRMPPLLLQHETNASRLIQQQSRRFVMNTLDIKKQNYIQHIETHQRRAERIHLVGHYLVYITIVTLMALALSYGISTLASLFSYDWPINPIVQTLVLAVAGVLGLSGVVLLHFSPKKLSRLLKQQQRLEQLSARLAL